MGPARPEADKSARHIHFFDFVQLPATNAFRLFGLPG